jgi:hypothetical protein
VNLGTGGVAGIIKNNTLEVGTTGRRKRRELSPSLAQSIELDKNANPDNSRERISPRFNLDTEEDEDNQLDFDESMGRAVRQAPGETVTTSSTPAPGAPPTTPPPGGPTAPLPPPPPPLDLPTKRAFWDLILIALKDCKMREQQLYFRRVRSIIIDWKHLLNSLVGINPGW